MVAAGLAMLVLAVAAVVMVLVFPGKNSAGSAASVPRPAGAVGSRPDHDSDTAYL